jgi:hypothetical protein
MILSSDPKKMASVIVASSPSEGASKEAAPELDPGLESAAEELIQAFEAKDVKAFASALKDFVSMCSGMDYSEDESIEG